MTEINARPKFHIKWIGAIALVKLISHVAINATTAYSLHRDEYLYLQEGDHLSWGYMEVPPMIAFLGKVTRVLLGDSLVAIRFFPALVGAISIILIGIMVRDMGGKRNAQILGASAFLFSPVFLGSNNLFQPVSFNQFCWLIIASLVLKITINSKPKYWYLLGITVGLGILTKYSVMFFVVAMLGGLLISHHRKLLLQKELYISIGLALLISLPNIWWQISHDLPVVRHMNDLASTQLVNVGFGDFIIPQILNHFSCSFVWIAGLV